MRGKRSGILKKRWRAYLCAGMAALLAAESVCMGSGLFGSVIRAQAAQTMEDLQSLRESADYTLYYDGEDSTAGSVLHTLPVHSENRLLDEETELREFSSWSIRVKEQWRYNPDGTVDTGVSSRVSFAGGATETGDESFKQFINGMYRITAAGFGITVYEVVKTTRQQDRWQVLWETSSVEDTFIVEVPFLGEAQPALASHESGEYDYGTEIVFRSPEAERYGLYIQKDQQIGSAVYESLGEDTEKRYTLSQDMRFRVWSGNRRYRFSSPVDYEYQLKTYDVTFVVRDQYSGKPIEGAVIAGTFFDTVETGEDGTATVTGLLSRQHDLTVHAGDYYKPQDFGSNETLRFQPTGEKQQELVIELEPLYRDVSLPLASPASLTASAKGPDVKLKTGQTRPLFNSLSVGVELPLPASVNLTYNRDTGKYEGTIGASVPGFLGEELPFEEVKQMVKNKMNPKLMKLLNRIPAKFGVDGDIQILGYVEAEPPKVGENATDLKITDGHVAVAFSTELSVSMPVWWIAYAKLAVGGGAEYQSGLVMKEFDAYPLQRLAVKGAVQGSLSASIGLGLGISDTVCVETGLKGEVTAKTELLYSLQEAEKATTIELTGTWYNKAQFLMFGSQADMSLKWQLYPQTQSSEEPIELTPSPAPLPRDYAQKDSDFSAKPQQDEPLVSNVFPYGQPVAQKATGRTSSGGTRQVTVLCWVDDARERDSMNRTALYYSVYDGESYTEPRQVDDDHTADFDPYLAGDGERLYLVWQNADATYSDDVSVEEMASGMGIKIAEWTGDGFANVTELTEKGDGYQAMPRLLVQDDGLSAVWVENSRNDCTGSEGVHTVVRRECEDGAWREPEAVQSGLPGLTSLNVAEKNGEEYLTYTTLDPYYILVGENNPSQAIYYIKAESGESGRVSLPLWQEPEEGAEHIQESVLDEDGTAYWIRGNNILHETEGALAKAANPYALGVAENDRERLVYWVGNTETGKQLCGVRQEKSSGEWSEPFVLYETEQLIRQPQVELMENGIALISCMRAEETDQAMSGETDLIVFEEEKSPRLSGEAVYLYTDLNGNGEMVPVYVTITNTGSESADGAIIELIDENGTVRAVEELTQTMDVNSELQVVVQADLPEEPVDLTVRISARDSYRSGDVDGNDIVDAADALLVLQRVAQLVVLTEDQFQRADMDGNGLLNAADALEILKIAANLS